MRHINGSVCGAALGHTLKFNMIIETDDTSWIECAMEYQPAQQALRVIIFC